MTRRRVNARRLSPEDVWQLVREYAAEARRACQKIPTLYRGVPNVITDVQEGSIGRRSPAGRTNVSRVGRSQVLRMWNAVLRPGGASIPPHVLYFTPALMVKALPGLLTFRDGMLSLVDDPSVEEKRRRLRRDAHRRLYGRGAGGESPEHKAIKEFIFAQPDVALAKIGGAPFAPLSMEYGFRTGDEVDVALRDVKGRPVLVEVKPATTPGDDTPWGQAAKYRTLWAFFENEPANRIRCVVAAPRLDRKVAARMLLEHSLESVVVRVPRNRRRRVVHRQAHRS